MPAKLLIPPKFRAFDANGAPLAGGKLYSYQAGTSIPQVTYTDQTGGTPNANPTILDANGEANVWIGSADYKLVLKDSNDVVQWTVDQVNGNLTSATDGIDGFSVRNGSGAPSAGTGNDGDFYIDTTAWDIYGPKASGAWPSGVSMIGPVYGSPIQESPTGTIDGSNTTFTISQTPKSDGDFRLYLDGLKLVLDTDFTRSGTTITMTAAPETGQTLEADYFY